MLSKLRFYSQTHTILRVFTPHASWIGSSLNQSDLLSLFARSEDRAPCQSFMVRLKIGSKGEKMGLGFNDNIFY